MQTMMQKMIIKWVTNTLQSYLSFMFIIVLKIFKMFLSYTTNIWKQRLAGSWQKKQVNSTVWDPSHSGVSDDWQPATKTVKKHQPAIYHFPVRANEQYTIHGSANLPLMADSKIGVCHGHWQCMMICLTLLHSRNSLISALLSMTWSDEHAFLIYLCSY